MLLCMGEEMEVEGTWGVWPIKHLLVHLFVRKDKQEYVYVWMGVNV